MLYVYPKLVIYIRSFLQNKIRTKLQQIPPIGKSNIRSEICLLSMVLNLNKLAAKIKNKNLEIIKYKAS